MHLPLSVAAESVKVSIEHTTYHIITIIVITTTIVLKKLINANITYFTVA